MDISTKILSDITVYMKYARYIPEKKRRETWKELVERNKKMHIKKYPELKSQIDKAYKMVLDKKVLPSMRSMQFAGKPIEISPNRVYNCAYLPIDNWQSFSEVMFFAAFFGALYYARELSLPWLAGEGSKVSTNQELWPTFENVWPSNGPANVGGEFIVMKAAGIPALNTIILLI